MTPTSFLDRLRDEIATHPAVEHPLLRTLAESADRGAFRVFGAQHYGMVERFPRYLELLLLAAPDATTKLWLARVLVHEFGGDEGGPDHATLYRRFLHAAGTTPAARAAARRLPAVRAFLSGHDVMCREESFLVGLGAIAAGHEWLVGPTFAPIVAGLRRIGFEDGSIEFFTRRIEQSARHRRLEAILERHAAQEPAQRRIRRGAILSLEARRRAWDSIQRNIDTGGRAERGGAHDPVGAGL